MGKEMMLNKYISIICSVFLLGSSQLSHAQKVNFQGSIAEFTCADQTPNKYCKDIQTTIENIKKQKNHQSIDTLKQSNLVANITVNPTDKSHKVIVLSYH